MSAEREIVTQDELLTIIEDFIVNCSGLNSARTQDGTFLKVIQKGDSREMTIKKFDLADVLTRKDSDGKTFVQINYVNGQKILLTEQLVGFKPVSKGEIDTTKLPKVVTTLDLLSVFEAIEESNGMSPSSNDEIEILKKVFNAILLGAEQIGFDISREKTWLRRLPRATSKISA